MTSVKLTCCGLFLAASLTGSALAGSTTIADFNGDFVAATSAGQTRASVKADGWDYMWNSAGAIGKADAYKSLVWNPNQIAAYGTDEAKFPADAPGSFLMLSERDGHHPGLGANEMVNAKGVDRFLIAAYTIQPGKAGPMSIADSSLKVRSTESNGDELRVYVNDTLITSFVQLGGADATSFNMSLGNLKAGDKVYVAVGPNNVSFSDTFDLKFKLVSSSASESASAADKAKQGPKENTK